jgi:hypothetical protein
LGNHAEADKTSHQPSHDHYFLDRGMPNNAACFVNGKSERVCGRHHIKPNDILNLLNEFWVFDSLNCWNRCG